MKKFITFPHSKVIYAITTIRLDVLEMLHAVFDLLDSANVENYDRLICIETISEADTVVHIEDDQIVATYSNMGEKNMCFIKIVEIIRNTLEFEDPWNPYHGTAIEFGEKTYVFLGASGSGKTTLAAFLGSQPKVSIVAEDMVLINYATLEIEVYDRPLLLRQNGYNVLKDKYNICFKNARPIQMSYETKIVTPFRPAITTKKYYAYCGIVLNLEDTSLKLQTITDTGKFILHSYLHNTIVKNIKSAVYLDKKLPLYKMHYKDLSEVYRMICHDNISAYIKD